MNVGSSDLVALILTLKLALTVAGLLLLLGTPLALWLARTQNKIKIVIESVVALPLVLPPTVLGFYLLLLLGPKGIVGGLTQSLGIGYLPFSFAGLVIGSFFYSLPFVVQPLQIFFETLGPRPYEVAATLRSSPMNTFFTVILPMAKPAFLTAFILGFAHTVGEFGVVLMLGGNIPGETQVLSIAIYDHVEAIRYDQAHTLAAILLVFSLILLMLLFFIRHKHGIKLWMK
jgi:molybdate transport system permease protein